MRAVPAASATILSLFGIFLASTAFAQTAAAGPSASVPRVINVGGVFQPVDGQPPRAVETVTLALFTDPTGGAPLWKETQSAAVDARGRYALLLGATSAEGIPAAVLAAGAQWLSTTFDRPGEVESPRVRLTSVPYTLRAADADTLGGLPASAYLLAPTSGAPTASESDRAADAGSVARSVKKPSVASVVLPGSINFLAKYVNGADVGNAAIYEAGGTVGIGTSMPRDSLHLQFTNILGTQTGLAVQNLGNTASSYSGMLFYDQNGALAQFQGFNNATHEYRINNIAPGGTINFMVNSTSRFLVRADGDVEISGSLRKGGVRFLSTVGTTNTFLGMLAGSANVTGVSNTASGSGALQVNNGDGNTASGASALAANTTGSFNTASGLSALLKNTTGNSNTASGNGALLNNTTGSDNTASGESALTFNTTGINNTASGNGALISNSTGSNNTAIGIAALGSATIGTFNVAVGAFAGGQATNGSNNIYLGANVIGVAGEANTMYLGVNGTQTKTLIAGIRGITTGLPDAIGVFIDSNGQLGTVNSSGRYKEDIQDMGDASSGLMKLRPVTYRYKQAYADGTKPIDYGLIAEEVEQVYPDLVAHLADGEVETVQYQKINAMLLNEVQKQRAELEKQRKMIAALTARLDAMERERR